MLGRKEGREWVRGRLGELLDRSRGILILKMFQVQASPGSLLYSSCSIIFANCVS